MKMKKLTKEEKNELEVELRDILLDLEVEVYCPSENTDYRERIIFIAKELRDFCKKYDIKDREEQFEALGDR